MKKKYLVLAFAVFICLITFCLFLFAGGPLVEDEERAIEIAQAHVFKKYKDTFDEYEIKAISDEDIWIVWYANYTYFNDNSSKYEWGDGGPVVHIRKLNGKVIYCDFLITDKRAMEIAKTHVFKTYNNSFDDYEMKIKSEFGTWVVRYVFLNENNFVAESAGPVVHIKKVNGEVFYCFSSVTDGKPVEDEERAIEIAKEYVFKKYNDNFDMCKINVHLRSDDIWVIYYNYPYHHGGGPGVHIDRLTGEVILSALLLPV
ncbi:MAG: hypothetical protein LBE57_00165 [Methanosarcinales archaeon]|jgi:hypothetical protein|nr:hypothetical protein [Methanosarcinales archaeon]